MTRDKNGYIVTEEKQALLDAMAILRYVIARLDNGSPADNYAVNALFHIQDRMNALPVQL